MGRGNRLTFPADEAEHGRDRVIVTDVADDERQQLIEVAIDDFVGRDDAVLVREPHVVLLGFVAREYRDATRPAHLAA